MCPGWLGQAWPLGIPIPFNIAALELGNTRFIPLVRLPRQTVRACPVLREKVWFHLAWKELVLQRKVLGDKV